MGTMKSAGRRPEDSVLDTQQAGPAVPRMVLGARLRQLREACGLSREQAGRAIRSSESKLCRLELGRLGFKLRDVADLLTLYGVTDETEQATALDLAYQANAPGWWQPYSDVIPSWMRLYLGLEQSAGVIRSFELQFVPGLLQTEDYARAVIRLGHPGAPPAEIERRVELRMRRQQILHRLSPPRLWVVIDEAALRRVMGGSAVMRAQLQHLIDITDELPHVTVQVLPFKAGGHAAGPVSVLRLPADELPDVVYVEQLNGGVYPDKPEEVAYYWHMLNCLATEAKPQPMAHTLLHQVLADL